MSPGPSNAGDDYKEDEHDDDDKKKPFAHNGEDGADADGDDVPEAAKGGTTEPNNAEAIPKLLQKSTSFFANEDFQLTPAEADTWRMDHEAGGFGNSQCYSGGGGCYEEFRESWDGEERRECFNGGMKCSPGCYRSGHNCMKCPSGTYRDHASGYSQPCKKCDGETQRRQTACKVKTPAPTPEPTSSPTPVPTLAHVCDPPCPNVGETCAENNVCQACVDKPGWSTGVDWLGRTVGCGLSANICGPKPTVNFWGDGVTANDACCVCQACVPTDSDTCLQDTFTALDGSNKPRYGLDNSSTCAGSTDQCHRLDMHRCCSKSCGVRPVCNFQYCVDLLRAARRERKGRYNPELFDWGYTESIEDGDCPSSSLAYPSSASNQAKCRFEDDGKCDAPHNCPAGTDANDCSAQYQLISSGTCSDVGLVDIQTPDDCIIAASYVGLERTPLGLERTGIGINSWKCSPERLAESEQQRQAGIEIPDEESPFCTDLPSGCIKANTFQHASETRKHSVFLNRVNTTVACGASVDSSYSMEDTPTRFDCICVQACSAVGQAVCENRVDCQWDGATCAQAAPTAAPTPAPTPTPVWHITEGLCQTAGGKQSRRVGVTNIGHGFEVRHCKSKCHCNWCRGFYVKPTRKSVFGELKDFTSTCTLYLQEGADYNPAAAIKYAADNGNKWESTTRVYDDGDSTDIVGGDGIHNGQCFIHPLTATSCSPASFKQCAWYCKESGWYCNTGTPGYYGGMEKYCSGCDWWASACE